MSTTPRETTIRAAEATGVARTGVAYQEAMYGRCACRLRQDGVSRQALVGARDAACRRLSSYLDACAVMAATEPEAWRDLYVCRNVNAAMNGRTCQAALKPSPIRPLRRAETQARLRRLRRSCLPGPDMEADFKREVARARDAYVNAVYGLYMPLLLQGAPRQAIAGARDAACRRLAAYLDACAEWATAYPASWRRHARPAQAA